MQVDSEIELKKLEISDAEIIFQTIDSEREYLREWLPFVDETNKVEDTIAFIESVLKNAKEKKEFTYKILYNGTFCGLIGFRDTVVEDHKTEIGYWLSEKYQRKGIITKACSSLIEYAFNELKMHRIQIRIATGNEKSMKIPEKLGFKKEGIERDGELLYSGYTDLVVWSLLLQEYLSTNNQQP